MAEAQELPEEADSTAVEQQSIIDRAYLFWPAGIVAAVVVVVMSRISRSLVQPYGVDGAEYIEHLSRLEVLQAWRELRFRQPGLDIFRPPIFRGSRDSADTWQTLP